MTTQARVEEVEGLVALMDAMAQMVATAATAVMAENEARLAVVLEAAEE